MRGADWIEHRRDDGEVVGWIVPAGEGFDAIDRLGRRVGDGPVDWVRAEELLEERGLGWLADRWLLREPDGRERAVRIVELDDERVVLADDDLGAAAVVGGAPRRTTLALPADGRLRSAGR